MFPTFAIVRNNLSCSFVSSVVPALAKIEDTNPSVSDSPMSLVGTVSYDDDFPAHSSTTLVREIPGSPARRLRECTD